MRISQFHCEKMDKKKNERKKKKLKRKKKRFSEDLMTSHHPRSPRFLGFEAWTMILRAWLQGWAAEFLSGEEIRRKERKENRRIEEKERRWSRRKEKQYGSIDSREGESTSER